MPLLERKKTRKVPKRAPLLQRISFDGKSCREIERGKDDGEIQMWGKGENLPYGRGNFRCQGCPPPRKKVARIRRELRLLNKGKRQEEGGRGRALHLPVVQADHVGHLSP